MNLVAEYVWRCQLRKNVVMVLAALLGAMSVAIVMAEATLVFEADLSLLSLIIRGVGDSEILVQVSHHISCFLTGISHLCGLMQRWTHQ